MTPTLEYLKANGGITLKHTGGVAKNLTFVASEFGYEIKANIHAIDDEYIKSTLREYKKIARRVAAFVGLWLDGDTLYIDISRNFDDVNKVIEHCKRHKQLAYYDAVKGESVRVGFVTQ